MIRRFYVHNFRCLENFELPFADQSSILLVGNNGAGKTTVGLALEVLQRIARGVNRVDEVVKPKDFTRGRTEAPMRFELEVSLFERVYTYVVAFDFPPGFKEMRVAEESLRVDGAAVFTRQLAQVHLAKNDQTKEARFLIDWHLAALPIVQERNAQDPLFTFKQWLARVLILRPIPSLITGESQDETLQPNPQVLDFGAWFSGLLAYSPASYGTLDRYLKGVLPDFKDIKNPTVGKSARSLEVQFSTEQGSLSIPFVELSDGEKCFMICAMVIAANEAYGPLLCFWDEADSYLALPEVGHFINALRREFQKGQFITTSHNPEAIRRFSDENTLLLSRKSHLEPVVVRPVSQLTVKGELVSALIRDDVES